MSQTSTYKQGGRLPRYMTQESALNGGIIYTDNTINEGYFNMVANMEYDDIKACLVSRKGLQQHGSVIQLSDGDTERYHVLGEFPIVVWNLELIEGSTTAYTRVKDTYTSCVLCAPLTEDGQHYMCSHLRVLVKTDAGYVMASALGLKDGDSGCTTTDAQVFNKLIKKRSGTLNSPVATFFQNTLYLVGSTFADAQYKPALNKLQTFCFTEGGRIHYHYDLIDTFDEVYEVSASEAVSSGYNMLRGNKTYDFSNTAGAVWDIDGILPTDASGKIIFNANSGQSVKFKLLYQYPMEAADSTKTYAFKWEWTASDTASDDSQWSEIAVLEQKAGTTIEVDFKPSVSNVIIRVTVYESDNADSILTVGATTFGKVIDNKTRAELNTYDLTTANGMTAWQGRLVLWGVENADNILFLSDINNASYFPYPNNVHIFDKPIVQVVNYMDGLLVFTTERIYLLNLGDTGLGFSVTAVQNRLSFDQSAAHYIQVIKNMVFFKTDNYFYMVVPKATSLTGELTIAPIYKAMAAFFNDPNAALEKHIIKEVYVKPLIESGAYNTATIESDGLQYNYVDQNTVRNIYRVRVLFDNTIKYITVVLNYDTATRVWTFHTYETNGRALVAQYQLSTSEAPLLNVYRVGDVEYLQVLKYTNGTFTDSFALDDNAERVFKNTLFIDTGYRTAGEYTNFKKRFREVQFKVFATADAVLEFGTAFLLDGRTRKDYKFYSNTAENGVMYLGKLDISSDTFVYNGGTWACTLLDDTTIPYDTTVSEILESAEEGRTSAVTRLGAWRISLSSLHEPTAVTFRQPVSGKGLLPRFKLLGFREMPVELNGLSWVYHLMNAR